MLKSLLAATLLLTSLSSFAVDRSPQDERALIIDSVTVEEVETILPTDVAPVPPMGAPGSIGEVIKIIDGLLAVGEKVWKIIDAGRPVLTTKMGAAVTIIPNTDVPNATLNTMANWSMPKVQSYKVTFKNAFGSDVVSFVYTIMFQYNGDYNGVGKYVTGLKVVASQVYAAWGFDFDATSELINIANVGSAQEPVASGVVQIAYAVRGKLNESRSAQTFYVDGKGNIQLLSR